MKKKSVIVLILAVIALIAIYMLSPSDDAKIKRLLSDGAHAIEKEDIEGVMAKVSYNYSDDLGLNYMMLKKILSEQFSAFSDIDVQYENLSLSIKDNNASASFDLLVLATSGNQRGYIVGDLKKPARITLGFEKTAGRWLVVNAVGLATYMQ